MMFPKDYSNTGGECLCKSCRWGAPVYIGIHRGDLQQTYLCVSDQKEYKNVGVCKYYQAYKEKDNG